MSVQMSVQESYASKSGLGQVRTSCLSRGALKLAAVLGCVSRVLWRHVACWHALGVVREGRRFTSVRAWVR